MFLGDLFAVNDYLAMTCGAANLAYGHVRGLTTHDAADAGPYDKHAGFMLALTLHAYAMAVKFAAGELGVPFPSETAETKNVRDILSHLDNYLVGTGDLQLGKKRPAMVGPIPPKFSVDREEDDGFCLTIGRSVQGGAAYRLSVGPVLERLNEQANKLIGVIDDRLGADPGRQIAPVSLGD